MSYQPQYPHYPPPPPPGTPNPQGPVVCPFCGGTTNMQPCMWCGRDTTVPRRPCKRCMRMVPTYEPVCWNCGAKSTSDLGWKIPLIIFIFVLAIVLSILIRGGF
jgi:hypothetical protein